MNDLLQGFILGFIQGLTEFLPVSSSGHLLLAETLGIGKPDLFFNLALHLATLLAIIIYFRKDILAVIKNPLGEEMRFLILSAIPTAIIALVIRRYCPTEEKFLPFFFILTSVVLLLPLIIKPKTRPLVGKSCVFAGIITGIAQGLACFSGLSRSGTTTSALALCGANEEERGRLSFLMSIPIIIGSTAIETASGGATGVNIPSLAVGAATAFLVGLVAIKIFMKMLKNKKIWIFSIYTFLLGIASFAILLPK